MSHQDLRHPPECEFAILGAGALGSILAAHLARAGHAVIVLARGSRAAAVQQAGLRICGLTDFSMPVQVLIEPQQLRRAQVLIVATKTPGTAQALQQLRHVDVDIALSVQNGVLKDELLVETFDRSHVLGAAADISGELLAGGAVLFTRNVNLLLGELSGPITPRAHQLAAQLAAAGIRATVVPDILSIEWSKFVVWVGLVVLSVLTRALTAQYLSDAGCAKVLIQLTREMGQLAAARGITLTDDGVLPAATLAYGPDDAALQTVLATGQRYAIQAPGHRMSSLQDVEAARPLEIHETLGHALQMARTHAIATPLLETSYALTSLLDRVRVRR
jgi:2-dehydropantoate 2-reductase